MTREHKETDTQELSCPQNAADAQAILAVNEEMPDWNEVTGPESGMERESTMLDIDRMVNEGLAGGNVTSDNGMIGPTTTDTMKTVDETPGNTGKGE